MTAPVTTGQSVVYLVQGRFVESDDAPVTTQFFNPANPNASIQNPAVPYRRCVAQVALKAGTPATTGTQVCPAADAGWIPLWAVTIAFGQTSITSGNIAAAPSAPAISVSGGGGGGGGGTTNWQTVSTTYTAVNGDKLIADTTGGAFTLSLPSAPVSDSTTVRIKGNFATNNLTVAGNGHNFNAGAFGTSSTYVLNADAVDVLMVFDGTAWRI
jgi:hypothetical protein